VVNSTRILLTVPATTPVGTYSLRVSNPGGSTVTRPSALLVSQTQAIVKVYLPFTKR
jgi:hypothetical protein